MHWFRLFLLLYNKLCAEIIFNGFCSPVLGLMLSELYMSCIVSWLHSCHFILMGVSSSVHIGGMASHGRTCWNVTPPQGLCIPGALKLSELFLHLSPLPSIIHCSDHSAQQTFDDSLQICLFLA